MKLNQVIAVEKGIKAKAHSEITELHKLCQKPELFNGFAKTYQKLDDGGEDLPPENKRVQFRVQDALSKVSVLMGELIDVTLSKDTANQRATGDIIVDGKALTEKIPVTALLFLEKELLDLRTFIDKLPVLDEADEWGVDPASGLFKTPPVQTHRTKKAQKALVLYPATQEHPAQTQLITEDILAGYWQTIKHSAAIEGPRRVAMLERAEKLIRAVKFAREAANEQDANSFNIGASIVNYVLNG